MARTRPAWQRIRADHDARLIAVRCALFLAAATIPIRGESQQLNVGTISGRVINATSSEPVPHATVTTGAIRATTGDDGRFRLLSVPAGTSVIRVRTLGYIAAEQSVIVPAGGNVDVLITMQQAPFVLRSVLTRANSERERFEQVPDVGAVGLSRGALTGLPALAEADLLRMVQTLPGVTARNDYSAGYNVRGGESDQNLVLLDGIPIYNPFHLGGLFSTFIDETVGDIRLLTGGFPASYGGRLSSVLDVTSAEEARQGVHGTVAASLLSSRVVLGGALPSGVDTWNLAARRTYADKIADVLSDDASLPYHFQDVQLHGAHMLKRGGSLSLTAYAGKDLIDQPNSVGNGQFGNVTDDGFSSDPEVFVFDWGNRVLGMTLALPLDGKRFLDSASFTQRASISQFSTHLDLGGGGFFGMSNRVTDVRLSGVLTGRRGAHTLSAGHEFSHYIIKYRVDSPEPNLHLSNFEQHPSANSAFIEDRWRASDRLIVRPGVRFEHVTGTGWVGVSPAISAKYFVTPDFALTGAAGRYSQWLHSLRDEDLPLRIFDFWVASDPSTAVSRATHLVAGAERWFGGWHFIRAELYHKRYEQLLEPSPADDPERRGDEFVSVSGSSYGADLFLRRLEHGRLSGWLTYGYGVSTRVHDGRHYFPAQDRRHTLTLVGALRAPGKSTLGAHFNWSTGTPYTAFIGEIQRWEYDPFTGTNRATFDAEPVGADRNSSRYPAYHRLDLSAERSWRVGQRNTLTFSLHLINVYNRDNVFTYQWDYVALPPTRTALPQFPILPSIGFSVDF